MRLNQKDKRTWQAIEGKTILTFKGAGIDREFHLLGGFRFLSDKKEIHNLVRYLIMLNGQKIILEERNSKLYFRGIVSTLLAKRLIETPMGEIFYYNQRRRKKLTKKEINDHFINKQFDVIKQIESGRG